MRRVTGARFLCKETHKLVTRPTRFLASAQRHHQNCGRVAEDHHIQAWEWQGHDTLHSCAASAADCSPQQQQHQGDSTDNLSPPPLPPSSPPQVQISDGPPDPTPREITLKIMKLTKPVTILSFCTTSDILPLLNARHQSLAMNRLTKREFPPHLLHDARLRVFLGHLRRTITNSPDIFDEQALSNTTHALVKLCLVMEHHRHGTSLHQSYNTQQQQQQQPPQQQSAEPQPARPHKACNVPHCKQTRRLLLDLRDLFWEHSHRALHSGHFQPQHLSNTAWGIAKSVDATHRGVTCPTLLFMRDIHALTVPMVLGGGMKPQELSNLLWAFAKVVSHFPDAFANDHSLKNGNNKKPQHAASVPDALFRTFCGVVTRTESPNVIGSFQPQHLANVAWALAKLRHENFDAFANILVHAVDHNLSLFKSQELSILLWSLASMVSTSTNGVLWARSDKLQRYTAVLLQHTINQLERRDSSFSHQSVANIVWAFATLLVQGAGEQELRRIALCPSTSQALVAAANSRANEFTESELAMTLWGLCRLFNHTQHSAELDGFFQTGGQRMVDMLVASKQSVSRNKTLPANAKRTHAQTTTASTATATQLLSRETTLALWSLVTFAFGTPKSAASVTPLKAVARAFCTEFAVVLEEQKQVVFLSLGDVEMVLKAFCVADMSGLAAKLLRVLHQQA